MNIYKKTCLNYSKMLVELTKKFDEQKFAHLILFCGDGYIKNMPE